MRAIFPFLNTLVILQALKSCIFVTKKKKKKKKKRG